MGWSPRLLRQRSCAFPGLDSRRTTAAGLSRRFPEDDYVDVDELYEFEQGGRVQLWRELWRRIVKQKRRVLNAAAPIQLPYDSCTYAQNFDEGSACVEPENLSRSFSARFANHTKRLQRFG